MFWSSSLELSLYHLEDCFVSCIEPSVIQTVRLYLRGMMKSKRAQWCGKNVTMYEIIHLFNEHVTDTKWALLLDTRNISLPRRSLHNLMIHDLMIEIY